MLGRRERQGGLFRPDHAFRDRIGEESFYGLLARHGAEWFRDEDFVALYREKFGRPSVPPSQLASALLLQVHDSVSDPEAVARSAFDLRWKVALGLELAEKLCAKTTVQHFRAQLVLHEAAGRPSIAGSRRAVPRACGSARPCSPPSTPRPFLDAARSATPTTSSRMGFDTSSTRHAD